MGERKTKAGITLIVLIVTVVILLILAGVSLSGIIGTNGVINNSRIASIEIKYSRI